MKRTVVFLVVILSFVILGVKQVSATPAYSDAGTLDGVVGLIDVADSGGFSVGSTAWVEQDVSSTFTGTVSSFSMVARSYPYTGSPATLLGYLTNQNNSQTGYAQIAYGSVCDNTHGINVTSTECTVTFLLDQPVTTTVGDVMTMKLDATRQYGSNNTGYQGSTQPRSPSWISGHIHTQNSGGGVTYAWPHTDRQFAWAWNHVTSTFPDNCTENCNDNILFLPGMEGSRLYDEDEKLWEPGNDGDVEDLYLGPTGTSTRDDVYTKDLIDEVPVLGINVYDGMLEELEGWKGNDLIAQYATAPYDWRLSMDSILESGHQTGNGRIYYGGSYLSATNTPYIIEQLRTLVQTSRTGKVTIIAHSYGGLVAKELMRRLQSEDPVLLSKIDNLVLVAVPQTGTPHAIAAGLHGFHVGLPNDDFDLLLSQGTARSFASTTPMFYNLLPSENYFTDSGAGSLVTTPPITFVEGTATQTYVNAYGTSTGGTAELYNFLLGDEHDANREMYYGDLNEPSILHSNLLLDAENFHFDLDSWVVPTSTNVYQIAGWGEDTVGSIKYETELVYGVYMLKHTPEMIVDGDGTVVTPSALAMSTSTSNVKRFWLNLKDYENATSTAIAHFHHDIFEILQLRHFIFNNIIAHSTTTLPEFITNNQPTPDSGERLHFFLHSPLQLAAHDASGNEISATTSTLHNAVYRRLGEIQYISLPASSTPVLTLTGYASGTFTLDVQEVAGNQVIASTTFSVIPTSTSTRASMSFSDGTIMHAGPLKIDTNGDNSVDFNLTPKMNGIIHSDLASPEPVVADINKEISFR